jgi:hypothetical protein
VLCDVQSSIAMQQLRFCVELTGLNIRGSEKRAIINC